jgi:uncharacterized protein YkwD
VVSNPGTFGRIEDARDTMKTSVALIYLIACTLSVSAPSQVPAAGPSRSEQRMFYLLNQERELAGLRHLEWNDHAAQAARAHARLLADYEKLSHEFLGEAPLRQRLTSTTVRFTTAGENLALADNADEAHLALLYSSGHRDNMLSPAYTAVGIGVVEHAGRLYVTEDFIHMVPSYNEEDFLGAFIRALNRLREARGMKAMLVVNHPALRETACSSRGNTAPPVKLGFSGELVRLSLSDPLEVPDEFIEKSARFHQMKIGACFRPDEEFGNGNFWVVAAFTM